LTLKNSHLKKKPSGREGSYYLEYKTIIPLPRIEAVSLFALYVSLFP
jgi:hypothetical protein